MNTNIWISLCLDLREGASDLKVATWVLWLFLHLGIKQHPNPCVRILLGSTESCKARRGVWERGFLVTQGKRNKGMSLGLPNSWLNFRAQFKTILRLVYPQQKKHFLVCLPLFLHSSPNTRGCKVLRAARSGLASSPPPQWKNNVFINTGFGERYRCLVRQVLKCFSCVTTPFFSCCWLLPSSWACTHC